MNCTKGIFRVFFNNVVRRALHSLKLETSYPPKTIEREKIVLRKLVNESKHELFSMILPPPNVTGNLHLGHFLTTTIEDVIVKWKYLNGYVVRWVPGTDHAGIATQVVVEKKLMNENKVSKHMIGRQKFVEEVMNWKTEKEKSILSTLNSSGLFLHWDKKYFTMDKHHTKAVNHAFVTLFDRGLIYRDNSIVNWSCALESVISDIEVENMEIDGPTMITVPGYKEPIKFGELVEFAYYFKDDEEEEIVVSTTRPETILGDVAVAVNPNDPRYSQYLNTNRKLWHPFREQEIPLIFDESVDMNFGTGAVKVTPAHDKFDFDLAKRHNLPLLHIFNEKGIVKQNHGIFSGLKRFEARERVKWALASSGAFRQVKPHKMIVPICSRSKDVVEYLKVPQWFLNCQEMAMLACDAVRNGSLKIVPKDFERDWFRWLGDHKNWCISRQLWWGHRIPIYKYQVNQIEHWVAAETCDEARLKIERIDPSLRHATLERDPDVLDTWFSSALVPFSIHGWPDEKVKNMQSYPLSLMNTGHDILLFWVARMVMLGQELTGQLPFKEVLLHGIICDAQGRKMSKSVGNVILPEYVINGMTLNDLISETEKAYKSGMISFEEFKRSSDSQRKQFPMGIPSCGIDVLRFTLCTHNVKTHFINFDVQECETTSHFFNKIWQATRFTLRAVSMSQIKSIELKKHNLTAMDRWILSKLAYAVTNVTANYSNYDFHLATTALKKFFYNQFCDIYLETTKDNIKSWRKPANGHCITLLNCMYIGLQYLSPIAPFLASELHKYLIEAPKFEPHMWRDIDLEDEVAEVLDIVYAVRQIKSQYQISSKHEPRLEFYTDDDELHQKIYNYLNVICALTRVKICVITRDRELFENGNHLVRSTGNDQCSFGLTTNEFFNQDKRLSINEKKMQKLKEELVRLKSVVENPGYSEKAKQHIKEKHLNQINKLETEIKKIKEIVKF